MCVPNPNNSPWSSFNCFSCIMDMTFVFIAIYCIGRSGSFSLTNMYSVSPNFSCVYSIELCNSFASSLLIGFLYLLVLTWYISIISWPFSLVRQSGLSVRVSDILVPSIWCIRRHLAICTSICVISAFSRFISSSEYTLNSAFTSGGISVLINKCSNLS